MVVGIHKIIRIGGRSGSPELEDKNLRVVSGSFTKTKHESYILGKTHSELNEQMKTVGKRLAILHKIRKGSAWTTLERFLQRRHPGIYSQLRPDNSDGFITVDKDPGSIWIGRGKEPLLREPKEPMRQENIDGFLQRAEQDIDSLSPFERRTMVEYWLKQVQVEQTERLFEEISHAEELRETLNRVHDEVSRRALLAADVIGITTTGLAKDISTLRRLRSKVVVCEEAAEVLEAHLISALVPGVEHFIQIGDHQQLRPQIKNYSLSLEVPAGMPYQVDRSQFERLAVGQPGLPVIPVAQLNVQRRMRPEISSFIRNTMYPRLEDHETIMNLPNVVGIRENVFWLNHDKMEDASNDDGRLRSHSNLWEVGMTKALVRHLVRQGAYKSTDIAVLTPYTGQLQKLRAALSKDFEIFLSERDEEALARDDFEIEAEEKRRVAGPLQKKQLIETLRLAIIDNFQGEEAKIVVVSLVRSNSQRKVGFLRTNNRINVLLSRAQHGMYLIGNADTYSNIPMWVDIRRQLEESNAVGRAFNLCCPRHADTPIQCAEPDDFLLYSPEGGCLLPCDRRVGHCGHRCQAKCHSERMHEVFACPQPCPRLRLTCEHKCPKLCGEGCGHCQVLLDNIQLPCGHPKDSVPCFQAQKPAEIECGVLVQKIVPDCDHALSIECVRNVNAKNFRCPTPCGELLKCGHRCRGSCGRCRSEGHLSCFKACVRPRNTCNHICSQPCHAGEPCRPCPHPCDVSTLVIAPSCLFIF